MLALGSNALLAQAVAAEKAADMTIARWNGPTTQRPAVPRGRRQVDRKGDRRPAG